MSYAPHHFCNNSQRQHGFTLLEILISFTLISIILVMMYSGMRVVYRASDKGENQINSVNQMRSAHIFLRKQLQGALPIGLDSDDFNENTFQQATNMQFATFFEGGEQRMQFVATMPGYLRRGGVYKQTIAFVDNKSHRGLLFSFESVNSLGNAGLEDSEPVFLLEAEKVHFQYYANTTEKDVGIDIDEKRWKDQWDKKGSIPALIRIDVEFAEGAVISWPTLTVAPARLMTQP